ncbi:rhamnulokinase [Microbacterium oleivorans]|uniref:Carbohydrate kinase n=1 Tax=Microbacterium oleivorans TaxID=273677 RepID=A0A177K9Y9_9MICO|nr:rhamnulokinase family protein [Microbacterium oleivorans]OAH50220.1 carbohydrate kinase [Microbacterium oleivorans]
MSGAPGTVAAVDLGATSGRVIVGRVGADTLETTTVARFANEPVRLPDGLHWNLLGLYGSVLDGLREALRGDANVASIGVDSWAVDYGLVARSRLLGEPFHYRDERTARGVEAVHGTHPHEVLFSRNGLQFLPFNTLYQLAAEDRDLLALTDHALLIPDLIGFWLTGQARTERTNASTTGLLRADTGEWDADLIAALGLSPRLLAPLVSPGEAIGDLSTEVAATLGAQATVTAVGSHDTASAVVAVPLASRDAAYISCGTWGLVGVEVERPVLTAAAREARFTNEGGVDGRIRLLRNVMGLWILSETVRGWQREGEAVELGDLLEAAAAVRQPVAVFDVDDPRFLPPGDMPARIAAWCAEHGVAAPRSRAEIARSIVESLAQAFADVAHEAGRVGGVDVRVIHVVGGGALNELLCQRTADRAGVPVLAGPVEATALGNILVQARAAGLVSGSLEALRDLVARTHLPRRYEPRTG